MSVAPFRPTLIVEDHIFYKNNQFYKLEDAHRPACGGMAQFCFAADEEYLSVAPAGRASHLPEANAGSRLPVGETGRRHVG
ncbi:hypothetical protein FHS82_002822 [Pseudochelatococcus lubricantis]|uniref:Uncharacterized protein n=1 Tax=Pseudochelatococcus lubricantis TaxID=1538102 RepID=A0ABX0V187_9HYPH|nr:hypothetical protein [Pseudochelatococcus lubricantis]NIJ58967.1 hypothetical protein [Pseudochelatococcus lubricantis]